jgi:hypothetical protein
MIGLLAILVATNLGVSGPETTGDWSIWMFKSSGWGGTSGIFIDAAGRNVAFVDTSGREFRDIAEDFRRGTPSFFCETLPLSDYQLRTFAFRVASIPEDVLAKGSLSITGTCADEPRIGVTLSSNGRRLQFGYSLEKSCRNGHEVPDWLTSLVDALWVRFRDIKACSVTPVTATSDP